MEGCSNGWLKALFLGQAVSFLFALANFNSSFLASQGVDVPITQNFLNYLCLAFVYGSVLLRRRGKLLIPWYWYLLLGFLDVHAYFLMNKAYQYSSITSITLLICWTIPWVIILTWLFLGTRYSKLQLVGSSLCVVGLVLVLWSDAWSDNGGGGSMPLLGDALVLGATIVFASANVGEELVIKKGDWIEFLAMLSVFGLLFSFVELSVFELEELVTVKWSTNTILAIAGYAISTFFSYSVTPYVLEFSGATMLNLSLLTSDMWAVLIRISFYHQKVDGLYFVAFAVVIVGLVIYSTKGEGDAVSLSGDQRSDCHQQLLPGDETQSHSIDSA
ncbi:Solute carrier family 35 member F1 [Linum perenne]